MTNSQTIRQVAFVGLGVMGYPMAGHLAARGHRVTVYNRTAEKARQWCQQHPGNMAETPAKAAEGADVVFTCVGNDDDVRSVVLGDDGALATMKSGAVLVDHTTTSAVLAEELAKQCANRSLGFLDAPVSGGQKGAETGQLTVMCGGEENTFSKIKPVMDAYSRQITRFGPAGHGQKCKMVNQVCIGGILQGLSEGLLLAQASGLDIADLVKTLEQGAAGSWQMSNRAETMSRREFDFGFAIDWMIKDLGYALDEANKNNLDLPLTGEVLTRYQRLQNHGHGRSDTSALILDLLAANNRRD